MKGSIPFLLFCQKNNRMNSSYKAIFFLIQGQIVYHCQKNLKKQMQLLKIIFTQKQPLGMRKQQKKGLAEAQYNLGVCYDNGNGVSQDIGKGKVYLIKYNVILLCREN